MEKELEQEVEIVHLKSTYFEKNKHFVNMLDENRVSKQIKRPYVYMKVNIDDKEFLLPLRSNLNHPNGFHSPSIKSPNAGIDYSHALLVPDRSYIKERSTLNAKQYRHIASNYEKIQAEFKGYLKDYIKTAKRNKAHKIGKFKNSTLLNFNKELGIEKKHSVETKKEHVNNTDREMKRARYLAYLQQQGRER